MEEHQYRETYHSINPRRCVFEKSISLRRCQCSLSHHFYLADREGVCCTDDSARGRCQRLLDTLRHNAIFAMHLTRIDGALPHAKEVKIQIGGLLGLHIQLEPQHQSITIIQDIHQLINRAIEYYHSMDTFPYDEIIKQIVRFEGRRRRTGTGDKKDIPK